MSARSLKTPELAPDCVILAFIGLATRFSAGNSLLAAMAIDADVANRDFLAEVANESFKIDKVVRIRDEEAMGYGHVLQIGG